MPSPSNTQRMAWLAALLFVLTLALYWRTSEFEFLNYDDDVYVTANPDVQEGLSWSGLRWAFTSGHAANWHPLTWLSHQLDVELFGLDPGAHHRTNALLHALNAALCALALFALTGAGGKSLLVAALFAWHPLRVESVAWVAERKDLLAAGCAFACLWAYAAYARRGGSARYLLCLTLFALGLLAKPMLVSLPALLLVLDGWPLGRLRRRTPSDPPGPRLASVLREKLPFLALALASAWITLRVQSAGGALDPLDEVGLGARLANALRSYGLYLEKSYLPTGLCVFHPHPGLSGSEAPGWTPGLFVLLTGLLAFSFFLLRRAARHAPLLVGWLWFLGLLVPVIGLVQVGLQGWAERYTYLPSVGLALALVWGAERALGPRRTQREALVLAGMALLALAFASHRQIDTWRDNHTLFEQALRVAPSAVAHNNLGRAFLEEGDNLQAEKHFALALELRPSLSGVRVNRASTLRALGREGEARDELERALEQEPDSAPAHAQLGWLLSEEGRDAEALPHLRRAVALRPDQPALRNNLAWVLATSRTESAPEEALELARELCNATQARQASHLETLAAALARLGQFEQAIEWQRRALERVPELHRARLAERLELYSAGRPFLRSP